MVNVSNIVLPLPNSPLAKELPCTHKLGNSLFCHKTPPLAPPRKRGGEPDLQGNWVFRAGNPFWIRMCVHRSCKGERELGFLVFPLGKGKNVIEFTAKNLSNNL